MGELERVSGIWGSWNVYLQERFFTLWRSSILLLSEIEVPLLGRTSVKVLQYVYTAVARPKALWECLRFLRKTCYLARCE
jgi:hypothetical protein